MSCPCRSASGRCAVLAASPKKVWFIQPGHQWLVLNDLQIGRHERHGRHTTRDIETGLPLD